MSTPIPPSAAPAAVNVWQPKVTAYSKGGTAVEESATQTALEASHIAKGADASRGRAIADPSGNGKAWTVVPTTHGVCAIIEPGRVLCGHSDRLAAAGAVVAWSVPSPTDEQAGRGSYAFRGIAVDDVDTVSVIDANGQVIATTNPSDSVFALTVDASTKPTALRLTGAGAKVSDIQIN